MVKKQKFWIILMASVAALLMLLYLLVIAPLVKKRAETLLPEPPELLEGEVCDSDNAILMFEHVERKDIQSIEVHNSYGEYLCYRRAEDGNYYLKGYELAPFSADTLASLVVASGYTVTVERVSTQCTEWEKYGLGAEDSPAWYTLTKTDGKTHKVYIGKLIPSGGGYYARYEGRDALYVLGASIHSTLLVPVENLITPYLGYAMDSSNYAQTAHVLLRKNGENFVQISYDADAVAESQASNIPLRSAYRMNFPARYIVNDDRYSEVLLSFCALKGYSTLKVGKTGEPLHNDERLMAQYGFSDLSNAPYELYYEYEKMKSIVLFAPSGIDGHYFAYSYVYNLIALVETETVPYLTWTIRQYVNDLIFTDSLDDSVSKIEVSGTLIKDAQTQKPISESFSMVRDPEKGVVSVMPQSTGVALNASEIWNFRQFYFVLCSPTFAGFIQDDAVSSYDPNKLMATIRVTLWNGTVHEYKYYWYSGSRCCVTISDGKSEAVLSEFYVQRSQVEKILSDAERAARGLTVDRNQEFSW